MARVARLLDEYLVMLANAGDEAAFGHLVRRWHRRLVAHAWRLWNAKIRQRALASALAREPEAQPPDPDCGLTAAKLRAAIRALPADQRAAIALFHLEEMGVAEVAVALDVPVGTVKTRLMHGRRKLRAALEGDD